MQKLISSFSKKGNLKILAPTIISLVFAAIVLILGIVISQSLTDHTAGIETSGTVVNESLTLPGTGTSSAISHATDCGYEFWTPSIVMNHTKNNTLVQTTDYIVNADGTLTNVTWIVGPLRVTYTYNWGGESCVSGNKTVVGLGTFADFWEIIVLAIVITVVIGLLLVVFGENKKR